MRQRMTRRRRLTATTSIMAEIKELEKRLAAEEEELEEWTEELTEDEQKMAAEEEELEEWTEELTDEEHEVVSEGGQNISVAEQGQNAKFQKNWPTGVWKDRMASKLVKMAQSLLAGCEKLPEGPMRDNCEKKKKDKKAAKGIMSFGYGRGSDYDYYIEVKHFDTLRGEEDDYLDIVQREARDAEITDVDDRGNYAIIEISSNDQEGLMEAVSDLARQGGVNVSKVWTR